MATSTITLKTDTTANWEASNRILALNEPALERTVDGYINMKLGDGITAWQQLGYVFKLKTMEDLKGSVDNTATSVSGQLEQAKQQVILSKAEVQKCVDEYNKTKAIEDGLVKRFDSLNATAQQTIQRATDAAEAAEGVTANKVGINDGQAGSSTTYSSNKIEKMVDDTFTTMSDIKKRTPHVATIEGYYNAQRTGKVYQTKIWKYATNPTSVGEKLLDNKDLVFEPSTDTVEGQDDYLNGEHPLFEWVYCNYKRHEDGTAYPIATEYDDNYVEIGTVDVGAMQMSFYWNWDASNPEYDLITISDSPNEKYKLKPWTECKRADGSVEPFCVGSAYISGLASDGLLRSQPNLKPERNQSHNNMITNYSKKGNGYHGAGAERNTFQILFNLIKGATKNSQSLYQGTSNYSFQIPAAVESSTANTYFPVTNAQANQILVGSYVSVGHGKLVDEKENFDRYYSEVHKYADSVKVLKIEPLDSANKAVYLDLPKEKAFNTTPVVLSPTVTSKITLTSMHWWSGSTKSVIGRHDGSLGSNTDGKHPYRVQGREYMVGGYIVESDTVMEFQADHSKKVYTAPKGVAHTSTESTIKSTYKVVGTIPAHTDGKGTDYPVGDIAVDLDTGAWYPSAQGGSTSQGFGDYLYAGGAATSGFRESLQGGHLGDGSYAGSCFLHCWHVLGSEGWRFLAAD